MLIGNGEGEPIDEGGDRIRAEAEPPITVGVSRDDVVVYKKGAWSEEEDEKLRRAVEEHGIRNWITIEKCSGLERPAKNCRLRWFNYLRPNLKKYPFTEEEEKLILDLHSKYGNSWARIASKLAGRSDNEIKNFWHKRTKKCKRERVPIYPPTTSEEKQSYTNAINQNFSSIDEANATTNNHDDYFPQNYPNHTLAQSQPFSPNIANNASPPTDAPSIYSPQSMNSTPQPQFLSSPVSLLTTSHPQQSPSNHLSHQTSQTTETNLSILDHIQAPSLCQGGGTFTSLRKPPPILSFPQRQFLRATSQLCPAPRVHTVLGSPHLDSSPQMQWSSAMESPRSPLKLKLSPGFPPQYSLQMSNQTTNSSVGLSSGFQLNSPTTAPLSPLKLRLSIPMPAESCFKSNLSIPDSTVELNSSRPAVPLSSPRLKPIMTVNTDPAVPLDPSLTVKGEPSSIQFSPPQTLGVNSCMNEVETDSNMEMMEEFRKAQATVRLLKKKLKQCSRNEHPRSKCSETTDLLRREVPAYGNSNPSTIKDCALSRTSSRSENLVGGNLVDGLPENSRKKYMMKTQVRSIGISKPEGLQVKKGGKRNRENLESGEYMQGSMDSEKAWGESSGSKISSEKSLQRQEDSVREILTRINSQNLQEQRRSIDLRDYLNNQHIVSDPRDNKLGTLEGLADKCSNVSSSMEGFLSESSTLLQDSFFREQFFGQTSLIQDPFSSQRHAPLIDAFGSAYSQSSPTTLVKHGDKCGQLISYLQPDDLGCSFRLEISDGSERKFSEHGSMDGEKSLLCESDMLMHQNITSAELLDFGFLGCEQFSLQNSVGSSSESQPSFMQHQYHAADLLNSSYPTCKQLMEQESFEGMPFSLRTDGYGNSSETSMVGESAFLEHQTLETSLIDSRYLMGFENEMEGLLAENLWPQGQMASHDQTFLMNRFDSVINQMESMMNWSNESTSGYTGVLQQEQRSKTS